jgi:hypothetical protein
MKQDNPLDFAGCFHRERSCFPPEAHEAGTGSALLDSTVIDRIVV